MIKGCQKQAVVVKCPRESVFESAYFILKREADGACREGELLYQADRLIAENTLPRKRRKRKELWLLAAVSFLLGVIVGVVIMAFVSILFY